MAAIRLARLRRIRSSTHPITKEPGQWVNELPAKDQKLLPAVGKVGEKWGKLGKRGRKVDFLLTLLKELFVEFDIGAATQHQGHSLMQAGRLDLHDALIAGGGTTSCLFDDEREWVCFIQ